MVDKKHSLMIKSSVELQLSLKVVLIRDLPCTYQVSVLGGVKLAFKDPSFAQGSIIFAYLNCHLPE